MKTLLIIIIIYQLLLQGLAGHFVESISVIRIAIDAGLYLLAASILLTKEVRIDKVVMAYLLLLIVVILSISLNEVELSSFVKQLRFIFLGLCFYILLKHANISSIDINKILNICFVIGYIQLPVVLLQLAFFGKDVLKNMPGEYVDAGTGTVGFMDSGVTGMFLVILLIIKFQIIFDEGMKKRDYFQVALLAAPLGLINSDAQFVFLPIVLLYLLVINFKFNRKIMSFVFGVMVITVIANQLLLANWSGDRSIAKYINSKIYHLVNTAPDYDQSKKRLLRYESMRYVVEHTDHENWILGQGPGYWLTRDSEGGNTSITNIWYHANTYLLAYGELGLLGVFAYLMFPVVLYLTAGRHGIGKVQKTMALYLFLLLFYQHPMNKLSIIIIMMTIILANYKSFELNMFKKRYY